MKFAVRTVFAVIALAGLTVFSEDAQAHQSLVSIRLWNNQGIFIDQSNILMNCEGGDDYSSIPGMIAQWDQLFLNANYPVSPWYTWISGCNTVLAPYAWLIFQDITGCDGSLCYTGKAYTYGVNSSGNWGLCEADPPCFEVQQAVIKLNTESVQPHTKYLRAVAVHEAGHPLGLDDFNLSCSSNNSIMNYRCFFKPYTQNPMTSPGAHDLVDIAEMYPEAP